MMLPTTNLLSPVLIRVSENVYHTGNALAEIPQSHEIHIMS